jgi:hypothetical protein
VLLALLRCSALRVELKGTAAHEHEREQQHPAANAVTEREREARRPKGRK